MPRSKEESAAYPKSEARRKKSMTLVINRRMKNRKRDVEEDAGQVRTKNDAVDSDQGWGQNKFTFMGVKMPVQQGVRMANSELFN